MIAAAWVLWGGSPLFHFPPIAVAEFETLDECNTMIQSSSSEESRERRAQELKAQYPQYPYLEIKRAVRSMFYQCLPNGVKP